MGLGRLLSIAASTITLTAENIGESLSRIRVKHLHSWVNRHIRPGTHVARMEDLIEPNDGTKLAQSPTIAILSF